MSSGAVLVRSTIWPTHVVALGRSQLAQLEADRALLSGRQSAATTARASDRNAGTVSRDRRALQRLGLMLRLTTRGRNGGTVIYRPSPAGAPPALSAHRRTIARIMGQFTLELVPAEAPAQAPPRGLWECPGCGAVGPHPKPAACRFCGRSL